MFNKNERLLEAAIIGDYLEAERLVQIGALVNYQNRPGTTPLHNAVKYRRKSIIMFLLRKGANVTLADKAGNLPLTFAIENEDKETILLLKKKNFHTLRYILPQAVRRSSLDMIKFLVDNKAKAHVYDSNGKSTLVRALEYNRSDEIINFLLKKGVSVNRCDPEGYSPLAYFAKKGEISVVKRLVKFGANINQCYGVYPLAAAVSSSQLFNRLRVVKFLVEQGAVVNPSDRQLPLIYAIKHKNFAAVEYLLSVGANVNKIDNNGHCALLSAVKLQDIAMVRFLFGEGAQPSAYSVFLEVIFTENMKLLHLFLQTGIDVNYKYKSGGTALLAAIDVQNIDIVKTLIRHGADVNLNDVFGRNPLVTAIERESFQIVKMLVENEADVNFTEIKGNLPLNVAIILEKFDIISLLLSYNVDVNKSDNKGDSPLSIAVKKRFARKPVFQKIVINLIEHGADVNFATSNGMSLLSTYICENDFEMVRFLVNKGAKIGLMGENPLEIAARNQLFQIFEYLYARSSNKRNKRCLDEIANEDEMFAIFLKNLGRPTLDQSGFTGHEAAKYESK